MTKAMNVRELIQELQQYDGSLPVWVEANDAYPITHVGLDPGIDDGQTITEAVLLEADTQER